ncbi:hypothetical protein BS17DRAFT_442811 [Gyrodon lividus]|nr:hypothetical protein BS17DRAFT_442811 [Gyrodon lividus]
MFHELFLQQPHHQIVLNYSLSMPPSVRCEVVSSPVDYQAELPRPTRCTKCTAQRGPDVQPRNLVVCIDGTSNKFGRNNTNVVKLFAKIDLDPQYPLPKQRTYYSSGIGTRPRAWHVVSRLQRTFSDLFDEAIAWNVDEIVQDAYGWLAKEYKEGDRIYLFGFSRGAYQVRILAGMIYEVGLIKTVTDKQIATVYEHYMAVRSWKIHAKDIARHFKQTFCWEGTKAHFVGVWDTVSSVGLVKTDVFLSSSSSAEHACEFRHALALDERRVKFMPEYFYEMNTVTPNKKTDGAQKQKSKYIPDEEPKVFFDEKLTAIDDEKPKATDVEKSQATDVERVKDAGHNSRVSKISNIKEVWFAGSHSDVGGRNQPGKSCHAGNVSLMWMRQEAAESGLVLKPTDIIWTPADLDSGRSNSMSVGWSVLELFPIKHQVSWSGPGENVRKLHLSKPRRIIPGQMIHASVLFANTYRPKANLGDGFVFPAGIPSASCEELDDENWEKVLFDYTSVQELFGYLQSRQGIPLPYLDRLLFVLRFKEGKNCVRAVAGWQEVFKNLIRDRKRSGIMKLVTIVAYLEASDHEEIDLPEDVLLEAKDCFKNILSKRQDTDCRRVLSLLRPMTNHEVLRQSILTVDVIKIFIRLLDDSIYRPEPNFSQVMDGLACLVKCGDVQTIVFDGLRKSPLLLMLAGRDPAQLTASLRAIVSLAQTPEGPDLCAVLQPRLRDLATKHEGRVGLLAVEALLELFKEQGVDQQQLADRLRNGNFRANLARAFNLLNDRGFPNNSNGRAGDHILRRLFDLGDGEPDDIHKTFIRELTLATAESDTRERTAATLTLLQLCEDPQLRKYLSDKNVTSAFLKQLKHRNSSLLGAHALTTCLKHGK